MYDAFLMSLALRFSLCQVPIEVSPPDSEPPDVDSAKGPGAGPAGILTIRVVDNTQIVKVRGRDPLGRIDISYKGTLYFGLDLGEPASDQSVWSARASFKFSWPGDDGDGSAFARGIVTQLQRDGLLTSCIREAYPGCAADRLEGLRRAAQIADYGERLRARTHVPDCR